MHDGPFIFCYDTESTMPQLGKTVYPAVNTLHPKSLSTLTMIRWYLLYPFGAPSNLQDERPMFQRIMGFFEQNTRIMGLFEQNTNHRIPNLGDISNISSRPSLPPVPQHMRYRDLI